MNRLIVLMISIFMFPGLSKAQVFGQPEYVGLTLGTAWAYGTLFEPTGKYYLTCSHWYPANGATLTFGNKKTGIVKATYLIRGGNGLGQYEMAVGELEKPVKAKAAKTWWTRPVDLVGNQIVVTGFGLDGMFTGSDGHIVEEDPNEAWQGLWYSTPAGTVRGGYSGAPIFFRGNLLAINWAAWGVEQGVYIGGIANTISMVFAEYYQNFPAQFQPPTEPKITIRKAGSQIEVVLTTPVGEWGITSSGDCSTDWTPVENCPAFIRFEECPPNPWQKVLRWNPSQNKSMFFRGEKKESVLPSLVPFSAPAPVSDQKRFIVTPCH